MIKRPLEHGQRAIRLVTHEEQRAGLVRCQSQTDLNLSHPIEEILYIRAATVMPDIAVVANAKVIVARNCRKKQRNSLLSDQPPVWVTPEYIRREAREAAQTASFCPSACGFFTAWKEAPRKELSS